MTTLMMKFFAMPPVKGVDVVADARRSKEKVWQDMRNMTFEEKKEYLRKGMEKMYGKKPASRRSVRTRKPELALA